MEQYIPIAQIWHNPSHCMFGYCSSKQDTKKQYWGQKFCQMDGDILVWQTKVTRPVKVDYLQSCSPIFRLDQSKMGVTFDL